MKYQVHAKVVVPHVGALDYDGVTVNGDKRLKTAVENALRELVLTDAELEDVYLNGLSLGEIRDPRRVANTVRVVDGLTAEATGTPDGEFEDSGFFSVIEQIAHMNARNIFSLETGLNGFCGIHVTSFEVDPILVGGCSELLSN